VIPFITSPSDFDATDDSKTLSLRLFLSLLAHFLPTIALLLKDETKLSLFTTPVVDFVEDKTVLFVILNGDAATAEDNIF
jgi:hypothetical protein